MNDSLISIIVPVYNTEKYVENTIKSIQNQIYKNIEIICVDDESTDNSLQLLKNIAAKDERIKVFSKENKGVTEARRFGFKNANGEYIGFVDADDVIEPTMYERLYNNIKKYNADISHCGHDIVWLDGRKESFYGTARLAQQDKISGIRSLISGSFEPGLWNKLYHNTLLHSLFHSGVMDYSIKINEDLLMNYYLFKMAETTVFEDVCLYHYIKREGSASASGWNKEMIWDPIRVRQRILEDAIGTEYEKDAKIVNLFTCINQYNNLLKIANPEFDNDKEEIRELIINNKDDIKLLRKKHALGARLIVSTPKLYSKLFKHIS